MQRFLREVKNAESLEHRNIASIYDRGVDEGRHYLVLEYVEGGDFQDRVRRKADRSDSPSRSLSSGRRPRDSVTPRAGG